MQSIDGQPVFSATDLVGFLLCPHLTNLERAVMAGLVERPIRNDEELDLVRKRGAEHERRFLETLRAQGRTVVEIDPDTYGDAPDGTRENAGDRIRRQAQATADAIARGDDVIYQAAFFDGRWRGYADFLLRVDRPSDLGAWSYEVADTKLAHHAKASALLQMCSYTEQLERLQGVLPEWMHVALGGSARAVERFRMTDAMAYFRQVKSRFEQTVLAGTVATYPPADTYPDPVEHCGVCRWFLVDRARWRRDDHLSLVAGISRNQRALLTGRGTATRRELAVLALPLPPPVERTGKQALERVREQARIQVAGEDEGKVLYELLQPERAPDGVIVPNRGLGALPEPSPGDLFFDMEGDPFAFDDGLEYLFGVIEPGVDPAPRAAPSDDLTLGLLEPTVSGTEAFHTWWSFDPAEEKLAFEQFIDFVMERRRRDPALHVYHYGSYERGRMGRLATRHATREAEVDVLLRADIFVDLLQVVRQGVRVATESYSIKRLEPLYRLQRIVDLREAGQSVVEFERYLEEGGKEQAILDTIQAYNRDDCESNWRLRDWLEERRPEAEREFGVALPRRPLLDGSATVKQEAERRLTAELAARLVAGIPDNESQRSEEQRARVLLSQLLDWHWREEKSDWWRFFQLMGMADEELSAQREPITGLEFVAQVGETRGANGSYIYRYAFQPQDNDVKQGVEVFDPRTFAARDVPDAGALEDRAWPKAGSVHAIDQVAGWVELKRSKRSTVPHPANIVPLERWGTETLQTSIQRMAAWVIEHDLARGGPYQAGFDLLLRRAPSTGAPVAPMRAPEELEVDAARRLALSLDATTLAIQGPPGSGKTYTAARMIVELVRVGRKVGITAMSHKVIGNLLEEVCRHAADEHVDVHAIQKSTEEQRCSAAEVECSDSNDTVRDKLIANEVSIAAGTAWLWSREDMTGLVDTLFVDEAGQLSLANVMAIAGAARNVVLLGDPRQLEQPLKGAHPPGAGASALEHLLGGHDTMPADRGLFLEHTRRLHPDVCAFTSEVFYEGRLQPVTGLEGQSIGGDGPLRGTGVRYVPVVHEANQNDSPEEAAVVAAAVRELIGTPWTDKHGVDRPLGWQDVLVVAPYNAHVATIKRLLPEARVGTVDKFQGQEAAVSFYSMATSSPEDAPRGMEFLYSLNRLNVATSRAKALAVLVCSPALIRVACKTPRQVRLANAFCRFLELAGAAD